MALDLPSAPYRQKSKIFVTPRIEDILVWELVETSRKDIPAYETPHPDRKKYPKHKLVFVLEGETDREDVFKFFYAADREDQDAYNFTYGFRDIAGRSFRTIQRTYVIPRREFDPESPAFSDAMANVPEDQLEESVSYIFYDKEMVRLTQAQPEIDSVYVIEVQTFVESALIGWLSARQEKATQDLIPERFRSSLPTTVIEALEEGLVESPVLDLNEISRTEEQINPHVKRVTSVTRPVPSSGVAINGSISYVENATVADVVETFTQDPDNTPEADQGLLIVESQVTPLGDDNYIKKTVSVGEWPLLHGSEWSEDLNAQIVRTEQFVGPPTDFTEPNTSFRPINKDRSLKIVEEVPRDALLSYKRAFPYPVSLDLPNILRSARVVWSSDNSNGYFRSDWTGLATGTSYSLSGSEGGDASASASVRPDVIPEIENPWGSDLPATAYFFYAEATDNVLTEGEFLARLAEVVASPVNRWPIFRPVSHTIIAQGAKVGVTARAQGAASVSYSENAISWDKSEGKGKSFDYGIGVSATVIPPTLHGTVVLTTTPTVSIGASATAEAHWVGYNFPDIHATEAAVKSATGTVTPHILPPTNPPDIPRSGLYVVKSQAEPHKWGWAKCFAVVLDASVFA